MGMHFVNMALVMDGELDANRVRRSSHAMTGQRYPPGMEQVPRPQPRIRNGVMRA